MTTEQITENAKAILLLCGRFGTGNDTGVQPLNIKEYDELATWLLSKKWWPADLLNEENQGALSDAFAPVEPARMKALLARGASMAIAIEKWVNKGLWVLCWSDEAYPARLKQHLKRYAPPILYGAGDRSLLSAGGLAVVVSSDYQAGGTWAGADEELRRESGRPVFVRTGAGVPRGNTELIHKGAKPFPPDALSSGLKDALNDALATHDEAHPAAAQDDGVGVVAEEPPTVEVTPAAYPEPLVEADAARMAVREAPIVLPPSVYEAVKPLILNALDKPRKIDELAKILKVRKTQLQDWVKLITDEGVIEERTIRKIKKLTLRKSDEELRLS